MPVREGGQASAEYTVIILFCLIVLLAAIPDGSPIRALVIAIRDFFSAYSYAISITS